MTYTLYGLKNCDSCRKALKWFRDKGLEVRLHDLRTDGLPSPILDAWLAELGIDRVLNKRSTTWRELEPELKEGLDKNAADLLLAQPSLIKRPLIQINGQWCQGCDPGQYEAALAAAD